MAFRTSVEYGRKANADDITGAKLATILSI